MIPTNEVNAAGGHAGIYRLRRAILDGTLRYANGGEITPIGPRTVHVASTPAATQALAGLEAAAAQLATAYATLAPQGGDVHLHANLLPQPNEPITSQLRRAVQHLEIRRLRGR